MKPQHLITALLFVALAVFAWSQPAAADGGRDDDVYLSEAPLSEICFVEGGDVKIRLTPGQYRSAKSRSRVKRRGAIRVALRARQIEAINEALGTERQVPKLMLKINAVDIRRSRLPGKKAESHFVVRSVDSFKREFLEAPTN